MIVLNQESEQKQQAKQPHAIPPFHQRFNIQVGIDEAKRRFVNRVVNKIEESFPALVILEGLPAEYVTEALVNVATRLGKKYKDEWLFYQYFGADFYDCLKAVEALYETFVSESRNFADKLTDLIQYTIALSETDLGIRWRDGSFWPSGAKLLDEALVNENLKWLSDTGYQNVATPFEKGLRHFLEASRQPERLIDTVRDMYEALEKMARIVCDNNKNLGANADLLISALGLSIHYSEMLKRHTKYAHEFRHAVEEGKERELPAPQEVEAFIYTTGLFIRLAIQGLAAQT